jgi:hypothetical protein
VANSSLHYTGSRVGRGSFTMRGRGVLCGALQAKAVRGGREEQVACGGRQRRARGGVW